MKPNPVIPAWRNIVRVMATDKILADFGGALESCGHLKYINPKSLLKIDRCGWGETCSLPVAPTAKDTWHAGNQVHCVIEIAK